MGCALALILAAIGLYGLLAYTVARRSSELGIRMALGASRANLIWLILQNALRLLAFGLLAGILAAIAASHWIASMLLGLSPRRILLPSSSPLSSCSQPV